MFSMTLDFYLPEFEQILEPQRLIEPRLQGSPNVVGTLRSEAWLLDQHKTPISACSNDFFMSQDRVATDLVAKVEEKCIGIRTKRWDSALPGVNLENDSYDATYLLVVIDDQPEGPGATLHAHAYQHLLNLLMQPLVSFSSS